MVFATLDMITRRSLLEKGLPIHWYPEYLFHSAACVRDLNKDTLKIINTVNLPVNDYGAVDFPEDFMDDLYVCVPIGDALQRLPKQEWITPLRIHDGTTGAFEPYSAIGEADSLINAFSFTGDWGYFWNVNDYGEPTGRFFGSPGGTGQGYQVFKQRRQIQLTPNFIGPNSNIVLQYISDGQKIDNASQVDMMAFSCIQRYIDWMSSPNAGIDMSPQGLSYYNAKRTLRANLNDLTRTDILNIIRNAYTAAIKT